MSGSRKVAAGELASLAAAADEQARHLTELTRWVYENGVESELTDTQIIALTRHQSALATLLLMLTEKAPERA